MIASTRDAPRDALGELYVWRVRCVLLQATSECPDHRHRASLIMHCMHKSKDGSPGFMRVFLGWCRYLLSIEAMGTGFVGVLVAPCNHCVVRLSPSVRSAKQKTEYRITQVAPVGESVFWSRFQSARIQQSVHRKVLAFFVEYEQRCTCGVRDFLNFPRSKPRDYCKRHTITRPYVTVFLSSTYTHRARCAMRR